jgi:hypothetical protein
LPADHARYTLLPVDRERNIIHSLADFNQRQPLITYSGNDIGISVGDIRRMEGVEVGEEEYEDDDDEGHHNEKQTPTTILLLTLPNTRTEAATLSSEQGEALIALHVKPLQDLNAVEYATNTGARKHKEQEGVWLHTSHTLDVEDLMTNTGLYKGSWPGGVDPDTHYAGETMLFPVAEGVHKSLNIDDSTVIGREEPGGYVDAETHTDEEVFPSIPRHLANAWSVISPPHPTKLDVETAPSKKTTRFVSTSSKTSSEPTFIRTQEREDDGDTTSAATLAQNSPLLLPPSPTEENLPLDAPLSLRDMMKTAGVPRSLAELEVLVEALAKSLKISPAPSYMDMYGGNGFDLQKDMLQYTRPLECRNCQRIDYSGVLLGLLNFGKEGSSVYTKDGGVG